MDQYCSTPHLPYMPILHQSNHIFFKFETTLCSRAWFTSPRKHRDFFLPNFILFVCYISSFYFILFFFWISLSFPSHLFTHFTCLFGVHNGTHWMKLSNWPTRKCYIFKHFNFFGLLLVWRYVHIELQPSYWNGPYVCKVAWYTFFFFFFFQRTLLLLHMANNIATR